MEASSTSRPGPQPLDARWQGLCTHIHATDDISFKLLALVPLVSIAGIATSLLKDKPQFTPVIVLLSLFAAAVTRALWIWERRNIQTCRWLLRRAAELEQQFGAGKPGQFFAFPSRPGGQGKEEAERLVYGLTIGAWLLLPGAVFVSQLSSWASTVTWLGAAAYALAAGWLAVYARRTLREEIRCDPKFPTEGPAKANPGLGSLAAP